MIDPLRLAPTPSKTPPPRKSEPPQNSFRETLREADGREREYLETSSNVRDRAKTRPDSREEVRRKVAEGKETSGDHRVKIVDTDEEIPRGPEEIAVLEKALRALDEKAKELEFGEGELVGGLTAEQAKELERLRALIQGKLAGKEPSMELLEEDGAAYAALLQMLNLEAGDAARLQRDLGFVGAGEPSGAEVRGDASIEVEGFGSGPISPTNDPSLTKMQTKVGDNPESGEPDLDLIALQERKNLMNPVELQEAEELDLPDPRFNSGTVDPERAAMSIDEQVQLAKANRLAGQEQEALTKAAFAKQELLQTAQGLQEQQELSQQQKLQELLSQRHLEDKGADALQTQESIKAQQMILSGNQTQNAAAVDQARLSATLQQLGALPVHFQTQRGQAAADAKEFRTQGIEEAPATSSLPQNQLSRIANPVETAAPAGMTFAQVQDLLAESPFDMAQLTRNLRRGREGEAQEVTLRLHPEELGSLTMRVRQLGDRLQVEMQVENPHVKHLVESNMDQLRNRFLDKDFNFSEMEVSVNIDARSDAQSEPNSNQGQFQEDSTAVKQRQRLNAVQEGLAAVRQRPRGDGGLNLYA